jgi:hypothetical protein
MSRAFAFLLILFMLAGCATRVSTKNPFLTVVWGDAYTLECDDGQAVHVDGEVICESGDSVEVRGGHIGESAAGIVSSIFELVAGLLPRGPTGD